MANTPQKPSKTDKQKRLSEALRQNLQRRKAAPRPDHKANKQG